MKVFPQKYPGIPKKKIDPQEAGNHKVYTDINTGAWRVKEIGARADKGFSWKTDGPASWKSLISYLKSKKAL